MFVKLVDTFLDLIALDEGWAELALKYGFQNFMEEEGRRAYSAARIDSNAGDQASVEVVRRKVFPDAKQNHFKLPKKIELDVWDDNVGDEPSSLKTRLDLLIFKDLVKMVAESQGIAIEQAKDLIEKQCGATIEQMAASLQTTKSAEDVERRRSPDLRRAMLRRYLGKLNSIASQIENFEELPVLIETVPEHLKLLLSNAHEASLLGQEIACAVLCGTAVEEALHVKLGRDAFREFSNGIKLAVDDEHLLIGRGSPVELAAREVNKARNQAAHDPKKFLKSQNTAKRDLLINARLVLAHLFKGAE